MNLRTSLICATLFSATTVVAPAATAQDARDSAGVYIGASYGGFKAHGGEFDDDNDLLAARLG
ncbi:hypothetical protein [Marinobacter sp. X15-166B]|uniref:hypothetical protein n=1 Tax=Marinobacter sp. X15-166B TaxID=1897620 RepID=UPI001D16FDE8|nr:hypothetical protein [Marinobacter sp. X15-166B]